MKEITIRVPDNCELKRDGNTYTIVEKEKKPAWNNEDERLQQCLIRDQEKCLEEVRNDKVGHSEIISDLKEMYHERIDWLKSLKERVGNFDDGYKVGFSAAKYNQWKPSDEQMEALLKLEEMHVLEHEKNQENAHLYMVVKSIREQLLKLRDE